MLRYTVNKVKSFPSITPANTKKMLKLHKLYAAQKYHDVQILYFFTKHDGDYFEAALELGCHARTMYTRVRVLDKEYNGRILSVIKMCRKRTLRIDAKVSNQQIIDAVMHTRSFRAAAKKLGVSKSCVIARARELGLKPKLGWKKNR